MILITGNRGFVGSHLQRTFPVSMGLDLKDGADILTCKLASDAEVVIHLAAQASVIDSLNDPIKDAETNILGTIRLLKHFKNSRFIFASSGGAIQEKIESPYGLSKYCAEEYIKLLHNNYIILRFPNIFGPGSHSVVEKFVNGPIEIYGDGTATRDYIYVDDLVEAIKLSLNWPVGTYSLGSEKNTSVLELAQATGKPITYTAKIEGELQDSFVKNTAPSWEPTTNVIDYIKANV